MTTATLLASLPAASGGFLLFDPEALLPALGPWALAGISLMVFIESGVLFPFLPGDSLLFTAGLLHEALGLQVWVIALCAFVAAFLGDQVGFFLGTPSAASGSSPTRGSSRRRTSRRPRPSSPSTAGCRWCSAASCRSSAPTCRSPRAPRTTGTRKFIAFNVIGAFLWAVGVTVLGSLLGDVPIIRDHVDVWAIVIVFVSVAPILVTVLRKTLVSRREKRVTTPGA